MVVIRLSRSGAKKRPFFNIVVTESRHRRDGRFNERIGFYNPMIAEGPQRLTYQEDRLNYWVEKGATMSDTVARIIKTAKKAAAAAPAAAGSGRDPAHRGISFSARRVCVLINAAPTADHADCLAVPPVSKHTRMRQPTFLF